ncbi:MAG: TonB family protein [Terriglobales bacterium]|jgi:TonB family protein
MFARGAVGAGSMAHHPISQPDPFNPLRPSTAPISLGQNPLVQKEDGQLEEGLSLAELATALSAHGGGALSADLALDLVLNEIVEHARLATGATAAAIALVRGDEIVCRATTGDNAPDLGVKLDVHSGLSGACVQSKNWQRCDDTETDSRVDAEICRDLGVRSILVFPVVREDKLLGVFEIFSPRPNAFSDREIQTLQALSRSIVNNVDRAADVVAPPAPVLPSSSMQAAAAATVAEVEGIDHLQLDAAQLDAVQLSPEPVDVVHEDVPVPVVDSLSETAPESQVRPRDYSMGVLTLAVITLALFLGWMMGYVRSPGTKTRTLKNVASQPAQPKPAEAVASGANAAARVTGQPTSTSPASAPTVPPQGASEQNGAGTLAPGGLVVYENGKVIYRTTAQGTSHTAKASTGPVTVPSKVADEYLMLRVEPDYPESAREQHIQGPVVLDALVDKEGAVEKLNTVSGDPQLAAAATDAVRQWRFKPFFRNGSPEEFQTQITVSFRLP